MNNFVDCIAVVFITATLTPSARTVLIVRVPPSPQRGFGNNPRIPVAFQVLGALPDGPNFLKSFGYITPILDKDPSQKNIHMGQGDSMLIKTTPVPSRALEEGVAIHKKSRKRMDCDVAALLAMTTAGGTFTCIESPYHIGN